MHHNGFSRFQKQKRGYINSDKYFNKIKYFKPFFVPLNKPRVFGELFKTVIGPTDFRKHKNRTNQR